MRKPELQSRQNFGYAKIANKMQSLIASLFFSNLYNKSEILKHSCRIHYKMRSPKFMKLLGKELFNCQRYPKILPNLKLENQYKQFFFFILLA